MALLNSKYMIYDMDLHLYIPQTILFMDKLVENMETKLGEAGSKAFYEDIAYFIKDFIIYYANFSNRSYETERIEYLIYNDNFDERISLQRAYVEVVRYALNDDGDMVGLQTGLHINQGQIVDLSKLRGERELSARLQRILVNSGLLYGGKRMWRIPETVVRGTDY